MICLGTKEIASLMRGGVEIQSVYLGDKIIYENLIDGVSSANAYTNTGAGHTGGETRSWTRDIGEAVKPTQVSFSSNNNRGVTCYWTFYGSTNNSSWVQLATASNSGGTSTVNINTPNFYRYYKVDQRNANWRRDDGNMVFSIEPWTIRYKKRK